MEQKLILSTLLIALSFNLLSQSTFDEKQTTMSNVRVTVNNVGTFGNGFRGSYAIKDFASAEYPANSGIEHLFEAGIWVGALMGGSERVSTAAYDQPSGYSTGRAGYEFTAGEGSHFRERSTLFDSPHYSVEAVSHQDFVADFTDQNLLVPGTQIQISNHQYPLGLDVHFESYNWNYSFSDFMIICNYTVTNSGNETLEDVYLGMWSNEVVRNVNITPAGQGGSDFYNKGGNGFIDSLSLAYCYDATGDVGFTESYIGHMFLGAEDKNGFHHPKVDSEFQVNYQTWTFNSSQPFFFFPTSDAIRYNKMRNGMNHLPCWIEAGVPDQGCELFNDETIQQVINKPGNRSDLVSIGPFPILEPGESITFAWAWVFAKKNQDGKPNTENNPTQQAKLVEHAQWAQTAYNGEDINFNGVLDPGEDNDGDGQITRFILPTPPDIPKIRVEPRNGGIDIYWSNNSEATIDPISQKQDFEGYNLYMTKLGFDVTSAADLSEDLKLIAAFDQSGNGLFFDTGFEKVTLEQPITFEDDTNLYTYKYSIDGLLNGWQYAVALTAFDQGDEENNLESLESSLLTNTYAAFPGTNTNMHFDEYAGAMNATRSLLNKELRDSIEQHRPYAYPNPYYSGAAWEGTSAYEEDGKITFANLPEHCIIRIFTVSGDLIKTIAHNESYDGSEQRWFNTYSNPERTVFSGGEHSWDLLSDNSQIIARGTYLFSVTDVESGLYWKGTFVIIK